MIETVRYQLVRFFTRATVTVASLRADEAVDRACNGGPSNGPSGSAEGAEGVQRGDHQQPEPVTVASVPGDPASDPQDGDRLRAADLLPASGAASSRPGAGTASTKRVETDQPCSRGAIGGCSGGFEGPGGEEGAAHGGGEQPAEDRPEEQARGTASELLPELPVALLRSLFLHVQRNQPSPGPRDLLHRLPTLRHSRPDSRVHAEERGPGTPASRLPRRKEGHRQGRQAESARRTPASSSDSRAEKFLKLLGSGASVPSRPDRFASSWSPIRTSVIRRCVFPVKRFPLYHEMSLESPLATLRTRRIRDVALSPLSTAARVFF